MNLGAVSKFSMFLSSYFLMFLALAVKSKWNEVYVYGLIIAVVGVIGTFYIVRTRINREVMYIKKVERRNEQVTNYLITYLVPFLGVNLDTLTDQIALGIILFNICILYIKADLIYINPTLMAMGYNVYSITLTNDLTRILITKTPFDDLRLKDKITTFELQDRSILVEDYKECDKH